MPTPRAARFVVVSLLLAGLAARAEAQALGAEDARRVATQAAAGASAQGLRAWIAVTDGQGRVLALYRMDGAPDVSTIPGARGHGLDGHGLEGLSLSAGLAAISKAGTGAFLSSAGHAFSTRTASFIVEEHFPPGIDETPGGPLFGVQFSSLACSDVQRPALPFGLAGDPGGFPLYRGGVVVGGVGVEAGTYGVDREPEHLADADDQIGEERAALAGQRGFEPPERILAERILADGIRLPYANAGPAEGGALPGGTWVVEPRAAGVPRRIAATVGGVSGQVDPLLPTRGGQALSAAEVDQILAHAAQQSIGTRAAIRQPLGDHARVSVAVVDLDGRVLGFFQNEDAPTFGVEVSVQKARTAAFFASPSAGERLRAAGLPLYVGAVPLDGSVAYSTRAVGFLAQPLFPPGIGGTDPGPFSPPLGEWSPFHTGLQLDLLLDLVNSVIGLGPERALSTYLGAEGNLPIPCTPIPELKNGITVFPGGLPLYRGGQLVGAIGVSGDGVDQDDLIASAGAAGFDAPPERRSDQLTLRGVRLPWVKLPRHPGL